MKLSIDFGGWTKTKGAVAVAGVLAVAGAVGSALAISPTVAPPIKWQGGWEAVVPDVTGPREVAIVPAGRSLLVTDIIATNTTSSMVLFKVYTGGAPGCGSGQHRLFFVGVPAFNVTHVPLVTGIGFGSGQRVCLSVESGIAQFNFRGFLFTAAP